MVKEGSYAQIILLKCRCMFLINETYVCMELWFGSYGSWEKNLVVLSFIQVCHVGMFYLGKYVRSEGEVFFCLGGGGEVMDQVLNPNLFITADAIWKADMPLTFVES
jgi:hypothetical protein